MASYAPGSDQLGSGYFVNVTINTRMKIATPAHAAMDRAFGGSAPCIVVMASVHHGERPESRRLTFSGRAA